MKRIAKAFLNQFMIIGSKQSMHSSDGAFARVFGDAKADQYRALKVDINRASISNACLDIASFEKALQSSMSEWSSKSSKDVEFNQRIRSVHLKIDAKYSELIPICINKFGFQFHHCKPEYVYLHKWMSSGEKNTYPPYCQHYIGTGGCAVDFDNEEILLITEKINIRTDIPKHIKPFKIPGGQLEHFEFIEEGVVREVWEETSVETNFKGILGFRYKKDFRFENPDIYYICLLEPKSQDHKQKIAACPNEIDLCQWTPLEVYYNLEGLSPVQQHARSLVKRYVTARKVNPDTCDKLLLQSTVQNGTYMEDTSPYIELLYPNLSK